MKLNESILKIKNADINKKIIMKIYKILYLVSLIWIVLLIIFIYNNKDFLFKIKNYIYWQESVSQPVKNEEKYISDISKSLISKWQINTRKDVLLRYCDVLLEWQSNKLITKNNFFYDPTSSVFMYFMCWYIDEKYKSKFSKIQQYVKDDFMEEIKSSNNDESCFFDWDLNWCNLMWFWIKIYTAIMNDYSNFKLWSIYWVWEDNPEDMVKTFSNDYFWEDTCWTQWVHYLYSKELNDDEGRHCSHPQTYKKLLETFKNLKQLVENWKTLKWTEIVKWASSDNEKYCKIWEEFDHFKCAFKKNEQDWIWYKNLLQNEMLYFRLLATFYEFHISNDSSTQKMQVWDISSSADEKDIELKEIGKQIERISQATQINERLIRNVHSHFPAQVWMMVVNEDMTNLKDSTRWIYTPLHQMFYLFRNVQNNRR